MRRIACLVVLAGALGTVPVFAGGPDPETDRFNISLGTYLLSFDTSAQASPAAGGAGTVIDLEGALGLDDRRTDFRLDGYWRFSKRHRLDFGLFYDSRKGTRAIEEQIIWDDTIYDIGATIDSKFATGYLKTTYRFAMIRDDRAEVGLSAGLATIRFATELAGEGTVVEDGEPSEVGFIRESEDVLAPVPVVGLYGSFVIREGLFFRASAEVFKISTSGITGSLVDGRATVDWFFSERWGVGLGLSRVRLNYEDEESDPRVKADATFGGGLVYLSYAF